METFSNATLDQWADFGIAEINGGQFEAAERWFRAILGLSPYHFDAQQLLGLALVRQRRFDDGIAALSLALQIRPNAVSVLSNLAEAQREAGNTAAHIATLERLGALDRSESPQLRLVTALANAGDTEHAVQRAIDLFQRFPASAETATVLAALLRSVNRNAHALLAYRSALEIRPRDPSLHHDVGDLFLAEGNPSAADACFVRSLALGSDALRRASTLGLAVARLELCDWDGWDDLVAGLGVASTDPERGLNAFLPLLIPLSPPAAVALTQEGARQWVQDAFRARPTPFSVPDPAPAERPLRVAFVSPDFRDHPVGRIVAPVLEALRRAGLYTLGVSLHAHADPLTDRLRAAASDWVDGAPLNDREVAEAIHARDVDVVVDLAGPTAGARPGIYGYRPGRVRVGWLGYPGSAGQPDVPFVVTDRGAVPDDLAPLFAETVVRLSVPAITVEGRVPVDRAAVRASLNLTDADVVMGSQARWRKIIPSLFWQWIDALERNPAAVLLLKRPSEEAERRLRALCQGRTFRAEQLRFLDSTPDYATYLARFAAFDVTLDTYPYGSHSMALDSLRVDTPLLALRGDLMQSRIGASIVAALGLENLIVERWDTYADRLSDLLADPSALTAARARIAAQGNALPILNPDRFALHFAHAMRAILSSAPPEASGRVLDVVAP